MFSVTSILQKVRISWPMLDLSATPYAAIVKINKLLPGRPQQVMDAV